MTVSDRTPAAAPPDLAGVWLVVPAYNEAARLGVTLADIYPRFPNVVVVDDGSKDDTFAVARRAGVWALRHVLNRGQGAALQTGIAFALLKGARAVVTFDADGQHDPDDVPRVAAPVLAGEADVVLGSRFLGRAVDIPPARRLLLRAAVLFTRVVSRVAVTDTHNGFRAFSRAAAEKLRITQDRMSHASEILDEVHRHRLRYVEVPVTVRYTAATLAKGQSSWDAAKVAWNFLVGRVIP
jgi:glycosyltransferase involved in cell wall biosynthesis